MSSSSLSAVRLVNIRVVDMEASIRFYERACDMYVERRRESDDFSLVWMKHAPSATRIELTANRGKTHYELGDGLNAVAFTVKHDIVTFRESRAEFAPSELRDFDWDHATKMRMFHLIDPTGYKIMFVEDVARKPRRVIVCPRWAGCPTTDWYKTLEERVHALDASVQVIVLSPQLNPPTLDDSQSYLDAHLPKDLGSNDVLVGHSVGNLLLLRWLAKHAPLLSSKPAFVAVAAWLTVDKPWPSLLPWQDAFDYHAAANQLASLRVVVSDNDPFTGDAAANVRKWHEAFGARVTSRIVAGGKHFNDASEAAVLDEILQALHQ